LKTKRPILLHLRQVEFGPVVVAVPADRAACMILRNPKSAWPLQHQRRIAI
jgi:hypothetical protein